MRSARLIARSLRQFWRTHLAVVAGVLLCAAILSGALVVGDSVGGSLRALALRRLGRSQLALSAGERFFRAALGTELAEATQLEAASVLALRAAVSLPAEGGTHGGVDLFGVDAAFFALRTPGKAPLAAPGPGEVLLGERLAARLAVQPGDALMFRLERPSALPREVGLVPASTRTAVLRLVVREVVPDEALGRFSLRAEQTAPLNAFVARKVLAEALELPGRANLVLFAAGQGEASLDSLQAALRATWQPEDVGLQVLPVPARPLVELRSERVFLERALSAAGARLGSGCQRVFGYLVNELRRGARAVPYSFVAAVQDSALVAGLPDDGVLANAWLARELELTPGDSLTLGFFRFGPDRKLEEVSRTLRVHAICPVEAGDPELAPSLPGLAGRARCSDWDPGLPVELTRIRPQDEAYWEAHRGTPKAFVSLATGQRMWSNSFGELTALRYPVGPQGDDAACAQLRTALRRELDPAVFGFALQPLRDQALLAARPTTDFGQLFLGLSFFLILSALMLTGLLFSFAVEQRLTELGALGALGFSPRRIRRLLLAEGACLAVLGAVLGSLAGAGYAALVLRGLGGVWLDAVGTTALQLHLHASSLALGAGCAVLAALGTMAWVLRRALRLPPRVLLGGRHALPAAGPARVGRLRVLVTLAWAASAGLTVFALGKPAAAGLFFLAGGLFLAGAVGLCWLLLPRRAARLSLYGVGLRAQERAGGRRVATLAGLAVGVFLVFAVGANRRSAGGEPGDRRHGTGGFAFWVETTRPVLHDLNDPAGREAELAVDARLDDVRFVAMRVGGGEDASCLNLNRVAQPRLLGVDPEALASRGSFSFAASLAETSEGSPWRLLASGSEDSAGVPLLPAVADENTVVWSLGKTLGDTLAYSDETGRPFRVQIVGLLQGSLLQGSLLIAAESFRARFPSTDGSRLLLVDAPPDRSVAVGEALRRGLRDHGVDVVLAERRLAELLAVENTYLSIFLTLGGLALLLGTLGVGIVVVRAILERRAELAVLRALGFSRQRLQRMLLVEHGVVVLAGLLCGLLAAQLASLPAWFSGQLPLGAIGMWLVLIVVSSFAWVWAAVRLGTRGRLLAALQQE